MKTNLCKDDCPNCGAAMHNGVCPTDGCGEPEQPITLLMYAIANRAEQLADMKMEEVRALIHQDVEGRQSALRSRGSLINEILVDEFEDDAMSLDLKFGGGPDGED